MRTAIVVFIGLAALAVTKSAEAFDFGRIQSDPNFGDVRKQSPPPSYPSSSPSPSYTPPSDQNNNYQQQRDEEEQQRQKEEEQRRRAEEERQRIEAEKERHRKEEFEKDKQEALKSFKGVESGEFGLKGFDQGGNMGLKDAGDIGLKGINTDPSVVDLSHLDPKKPMVVDPAKVQGQPPAAASGLDFMDPSKPASAPSDATGQTEAESVRERRDITDYMLRLKNDKPKLAQGNPKANMMLDALEYGRDKGGWDASIDYLKKAQSANPNNQAASDALKELREIYANHVLADQRFVDKVVEHDYSGALRAIQKAVEVNPNDEGLRRNLEYVKGLYDGQKNAAGH